MMNYPLVWVVKRKDGHYLADSFHHTHWTPELIAARSYLNYIDAQITAEREEGTLTPVSLVEGVLQ